MAYTNLRDGDAIITSDGFVFYVFGYEHPDDAYHAFLKYVPEEQSRFFDIDWLDITWRFGESTLLRPRTLFSPENHKRLVKALVEYFPEYVRYSVELRCHMILVPRGLIEQAFVPSRSLLALIRGGASDNLEKKALSLIWLLSKNSAVPHSSFGIHGSIGLGIHRERSDIDVAVYGGYNFRSVKETLLRLEKAGDLVISCETQRDLRRLNRGIYEGVRFVVNATRRFSEISRQRRAFRSLGTVELYCHCIGIEESMYRPSIYQVTECRSIRGSEKAAEVREIASMDGIYRDVLRTGDRIRVRGVLEEVVSEDGEKTLRVVVGSGSGGEYIDWTRP